MEISGEILEDFGEFWRILGFLGDFGGFWRILEEYSEF